MNEKFKIGELKMAQVLKDEIRENILKAALQEFFEKGYKSAAMRHIATQAKIPTGLIYSYYEIKKRFLKQFLDQYCMIGNEY